MTGRQAGTAVVAIMFLLAAGPAFAKPKSSPPEERAKAVTGPDGHLSDLLRPMPKDDHPFFVEVLTQEVVARR